MGVSYRGQPSTITSVGESVKQPAHRHLTAKWATVCPRCTKRIEVGMRIANYDGSGWVHVACRLEYTPDDVEATKAKLPRSPLMRALADRQLSNI